MAIHLFGGLLLRPFPAATGARIRSLVQRRVRLWFSTSGEDGLTGIDTLLRDIRDGGELARACPGASAPRRPGGRGRGGGGSRRRRAQNTQREQHHPPTRLSKGDLRRRVALRRARELVEVGQLRRARMALDGADFGMVEDADAALAALQRLHPPPGTPHPDCDLPDPLPPPGAPTPPVFR